MWRTVRVSVRGAFAAPPPASRAPLCADWRTAPRTTASGTSTTSPVLSAKRAIQTHLRLTHTLRPSIIALAVRRESAYLSARKSCRTLGSALLTASDAIPAACWGALRIGQTLMTLPTTPRILRPSRFGASVISISLASPSSSALSATMTMVDVSPASAFWKLAGSGSSVK